MLERGAWAGPGGSTKVSHPTPWRLRSRHWVTMAKQSINGSLGKGKGKVEKFQYLKKKNLLWQYRNNRRKNNIYWYRVTMLPK